MNLTYGICVAPNFNKDYVNNLVDSIVNQRHGENKWEVIFCGGGIQASDLYIQSEHFKFLDFDETLKPRGWITKKKNDIVKAAQYENVVIVHDYYVFDDIWYIGLRKFDYNDPNWKVLTNTILTQEGFRHSDWTVNQRYMDRVLEKFPHLHGDLMAIAPGENGPKWVCGLPYEVTDLTHIQYISGGFILAKKAVLEEVPLNETLLWGDSEDIIWSQDLVQHGIKFQFNPWSFMYLQKPGKWKVYQMTDDCIECLREMFGSADTRLNEIIEIRTQILQ